MSQVTVVIPTHNRAGLIAGAVEDVLAQSHTDLEVVVVDDASTDETAEVVAGIGDTRVRLVRLEENLRIAGARNAGIDAAHGDWVAFHDDDDRWDPRKLAAQLVAAAEADVVYCPYAISRRGRAIAHHIPLPQGDVFTDLARGWAPPLGSSIMIRRSAIGSRRFDRSVEGIEDIDFWLTMAGDHAWAVVPEALVTLAKDGGSRATHAIARRADAIERLRRKWLPEMVARGLADEWERTCALHLTVARLEGPLPPARQRASLAVDLARLPIGRRTKMLGVARLTLGHAATDRLVDRYFALRGT